MRGDLTMKHKTLDRQTIVITGASSGIGPTTARAALHPFATAAAMAGFGLVAALIAARQSNWSRRTRSPSAMQGIHGTNEQSKRR